MSWERVDWRRLDIRHWSSRHIHHRWLSRRWCRRSFFAFHSTTSMTTVRFASADDSCEVELVRLSFDQRSIVRAANERPWDSVVEWHVTWAAVLDATSTRAGCSLAMHRAAEPWPLPSIFGATLVTAPALCLHRPAPHRSESRWPARTDAAARSWSRRSDCCSCFETCPCCRRGRAGDDSTATWCHWSLPAIPKASRSHRAGSSSTECENCHANLSISPWLSSLQSQEEKQSMNEHQCGALFFPLRKRLSRALHALSAPSLKMMMHEAHSQTKTKRKMCKTSSWYLLGALWINAWKEGGIEEKKSGLTFLMTRLFFFSCDAVSTAVKAYQLIPCVLEKSFILSAVEVLIPDRGPRRYIRYQLINVQIRERRQRTHRVKLQFKTCSR